MSGGSFNYLCHKEPDDLLCDTSDMKAMASALTEVGAKDAAAETEAAIAYLEHAERQSSARFVRLKEIWKAMEWWRSGDWGKEQFDNALARYRNQPPALKE